MTEPCTWIKSSYSNNGGNCVEVAADLTATGIVPVRDSKRPEGLVLMVSVDAFEGLVDLARSADL
ncbi:DUF397 domain-containing protein [Streptomyces sp. NPDC000594]|uniref:DUF397 domain-containing protein n=1 Tax=Streptomyces sp. NPDC000594 TaxID=3154261 RepID=UPI00331ACF52